MRDRLPPVALRAAPPLAVLALYYWILFPGAAYRSSASTSLATPSLEASAALVEQAAALMHEERYEQALEPLLLLHAANPSNHVYAGQLATASRRLDRPKDEARYLEEYIKYSPTPFEACPRIGEVYWAQGLAEKSLDAYKRCFDFDHEDPDAVFYMARAFEWAQRYDEAQELYERGRQLDRGYLDMRLGLARLSLRRGHLVQARTAAAQVLRDDQKNVDAMLIVGLAFQLEGNRREARRYLERGVAIKETYADFHVALGILEEEEDHAQRAMQRYDRALELNAANGDAILRKKRLAVRMTP